MKNLEQYVGRTVKGIRFQNNGYFEVAYLDSMDAYVGYEGVIECYDSSSNTFKVNFTSPKKDSWYYPVEVILPQLEGELVGYLVEDSKYVKIIAGLANHSVEHLLELTSEGVHFTPKSYIGEIVVKYDLLAKCTPVYKPAKVELPKINGYEGEDKGDYIQYGCAKLLKSWFEGSESRYIFSLELNSGIRIDFEEMNEIRKYLDSKK